MFALLHSSYDALPMCDLDSVIGHTRFATSSVNTVPELHPHEWVPFHDEKVWLFSPVEGNFQHHIVSTGIHITHNGDFDALGAYSQTMVEKQLYTNLYARTHVITFMSDYIVVAME